MTAHSPGPTRSSTESRPYLHRYRTAQLLHSSARPTCRGFQRAHRRGPAAPAPRPRAPGVRRGRGRPPRGVAVHADRVDVRPPAGGELDGPPRDLRRCRSAPRRARTCGTSRPSGAVGPVREALVQHRPPGGRAPGRAASPGIPSTGRPPDPASTAARLLRVVDHPVVERPVRLDVAHRSSPPPPRSRQGPDLVGHLLAQQVVRRRPGRPGRSSPGRRRRPARPTETPSRAASLAHRAHDRGVAGVVAAGDVGAGHDLEQGRVVGDLLAEVGVEVDVPGTHDAGHRWSAR